MAIRPHSSGVRLPTRSFLLDTRASDESRRLTICSRDISRLKNATGRLLLTATLRAMFSAKLVLPMPGRAPTMIISDRLRPVVSSSRAAMPLGMPTN